MARCAAILVVIGLGAGSAPAWAEKASRSPSRILSLDDAIQAAYDRNRTIQQAKLVFEDAQLTYDNAWDAMFMPSISLTLSSTAYSTIGRFARSEAANLEGNTRTATNAHGFPDSSAALSLGEYTLFNFWRDQLTYENARLSYERAKETLEEAKRTVKFEVIGAYFNLKTAVEQLDVARRSVKISRAILKLIQSRKRIGKASSTDVSSAKVDLLIEKNNFNDTASTVRTAKWALNQLLADPVGSNYRLKSLLKYNLLRMSKRQAFETFLANSATIKDARMLVLQGQNNLKLAQKNRLPLPTVSLSGVTFTYGDTYYGGSFSRTTTSRTFEGNFNISASVSLTLPILGEGGLFSHRTVASARIFRDSAEVSYRQSTQTGYTTILTTIDSILREQTNIKNQKEAFDENSSVLDSLFSGLASGEISRLELRDAITRARLSEFELKASILNHLNQKLALADLIGVNELPGDSFQ